MASGHTLTHAIEVRLGTTGQPLSVRTGALATGSLRTGANQNVVRANMITGDLVKLNAAEPLNIYGVVMHVDRNIQVLWLDDPVAATTAWHEPQELTLSSSCDLDWRDGVLTLNE